MADTFVGGSETTTNALSEGVRLLIANPDQWTLLKSDPNKYVRLPAEEVLRLEGPVQGLFRSTTQEVVLHGVTIPAGAVAQCWPDLRCSRLHLGQREGSSTILG